MKILYFAQAVTACWNNGNAHFLRGLGRSLVGLGHRVLFVEAENNWCEQNLKLGQGPRALESCKQSVSDLEIVRHPGQKLDLEELLEEVEMVIVHEWNDPALIAELGKRRRRSASFVLLFHDTHHRALSAPKEMDEVDLEAYDGVLAFGESIADIYRRRGWGRRVFVFHEAADTTSFFPRKSSGSQSDLIWIGNWGDDERTAELREYFIEPVCQLGLMAESFGVRYPVEAKEELKQNGVAFGGWLPNHAVPDQYSRYRFTVHVPRRPYALRLPGIPTIRVFEALACGIPLICAPWVDSEGLFGDGCYLKASDGVEMRAHMRSVLFDEDLRVSLIRRGREMVETRHTCGHRAKQLMTIYEALWGPARKRDVA